MALGIGQFAENVDPQEISARTRGGMFTPTLAGAPGPRLARSRSAWPSKVYTGTRLVFQGFVRTQGGVNSSEALDVHVNAPIKRNRSRALGQHRGQPYMAQPTTGGTDA